MNITKEPLQEKVLKHFGLRKDPFSMEPDSIEEVFQDETFNKAKRTIWSAINNQKFLVVTAPTGRGKTVLLDSITQEIMEKENILFCKPLIFETDRLRVGQICDAIIEDWIEIRPKRSLTAKARQLAAFLKSSAKGGRKHVLLIEDAHHLNWQTLLALKAMWDMKLGFERLLSIILFGQDRIAHYLNNEEQYREVAERAQIFPLPMMNGAIPNYIAFQIRNGGGDPDRIFNPSSLQAISKRCATPQMANNLVARLLIDAETNGFHEIDQNMIDGLKLS